MMKKHDSLVLKQTEVSFCHRVSAILYTSETWTVLDTDTRNLESFRMK